MTLVSTLNDWVGKIVSMLVFPMIGILVWEVILRYVFNSPTVWAHELSAILYAIFFLLGGAYTLRWKAHINVDIVYYSLPPRVRAIVDLITWMVFYYFILIMLWKGTEFAWSSVTQMERASTVWEPYIWPSKICIPLAAFLILIQGITKSLNDVLIVFTGQDLLSEMEKESGR
jgi:TRAP-type mannitol/chloroaromatic compound transport system permease small subunit